MMVANKYAINLFNKNFPNTSSSHVGLRNLLNKFDEIGSAIDLNKDVRNITKPIPL